MAKQLILSTTLSDIDAYWNSETGSHLLVLQNESYNRVAAQVPDKKGSQWILPCGAKCKTLSETKELIYRKLLKESRYVYDELCSRLSCTTTLAGKHITIVQQRVINHALRLSCLDELMQALAVVDLPEKCQLKSHTEIEPDAALQITHDNIRFTIFPIQINLDHKVFSTEISNNPIGFSIQTERVRSDKWELVSKVLCSQVNGLELADIATAAEHVVDQIVSSKPIDQSAHLVFETQAAKAERIFGKTLSVY